MIRYANAKQLLNAGKTFPCTVNNRGCYIQQNGEEKGKSTPTKIDDRNIAGAVVGAACPLGKGQERCLLSLFPLKSTHFRSVQNAAHVVMFG